MLTSRVFFQTIGIAALVINACVGEAASSAHPKESSAAPHFAITWVGGPTMLITFGDLAILTDPTLGETFAMGDPNDAVDHEKIRMHRRLTPITGVALKAVDLVLLSHVHPDHFDQQASADLDRALLVMLPIADTGAVGAKGFTKLDGLKWGESRRLDAGTGHVTITAVPARHSRDPAMAKALGTGNGYWIEFSDGAWKRTMYWTGDSMPAEDVVNAVRSLAKLDLLVPHVGGVGPTGPLGQISMRATDVVALAAAVHPKYVLPIHHSTYAFYLEPISELALRSREEPYRLDLIAAGSTVVYR